MGSCCGVCCVGDVGVMWYVVWSLGDVGVMKHVVRSLLYE